MFNMAKSEPTGARNRLPGGRKPRVTARAASFGAGRASPGLVFSMRFSVSYSSGRNLERDFARISNSRTKATRKLTGKIIDHSATTHASSATCEGLK